MSNCIIKYESLNDEKDVLSSLINYYYNRLKYAKDKKFIIEKINELQSRLDEILNNHIIKK